METFVHQETLVQRKHIRLAREALSSLRSRASQSAPVAGIWADSRRRLRDLETGSREVTSRPTAASSLGVLLWLALALLAVRMANAQGTVVFSTRINAAGSPSQTTHVWGPSTYIPTLSYIGLGSNDNPSGTTPFGSASGMALIGASGSGGHYGYTTTHAQLIGAVGANQPESALVPVGQVNTFRTGTSLGCIATVTDTLTGNPGIPSAAPYATFEIVAWDNSSGLYPTWTQASAAWHSGQIVAGHSAPFTVTNIGGGLNLPPYLNNYEPITSFNLYLRDDLIILHDLESQVVGLGKTAAFSVGLSNPPAHFQWYHNGTPVPGIYYPGGLSTWYTIASVQAADAGSYHVALTNYSGVWTNSAVARLDVVSYPGLVSWWRAEDNALDCMSANHGTPLGGVAYAAAKAGKGFTFDSDDDRITIAHNTNLDFQVSGFTCEFWMQGVKNQPQTNFLVVEKSFGWLATNGWGFQGTSSNGVLGFLCKNGASWSRVDGPDVLDGNFHHVAGTWNGSLLALYVDGALQGTAALSNPATNNGAVSIGYQWDGSTALGFFRGQVDEMAIYSRALSPAEVQGMYQAGAGGKLGMAPVIISPPTNLVMFAGFTSNLAVSVSGSAPYFQWRRSDTNLVNGGRISGATSSTLTIGSVACGDAGEYSVVVTNAYGALTSSVALVSVTDAAPPSISCPPNLTVTTEAGQCSASGVSLGSSTASVACGTVMVTNNAPAQFPIGTNVVTWTATAANGNTNTCAQLVVVRETPPGITTPPQGRTNNMGSPATFTVSATACSTLGYQWRKNGTPLGGATGSSLILANVLPGDAASYTVTVTNAGGSVTSDAATLTVVEQAAVLNNVFVTAFQGTNISAADNTPCPPSCAAGLVSSTGSGSSSTASPIPVIPASDRRARFGYGAGCAWSVTPTDIALTPAFGGPRYNFTSLSRVPGVYKIYYTKGTSSSGSADMVVNMTASGGNLADAAGVGQTSVPLTVFRTTAPNNVWIPIGFITNTTANPTISFTHASGTITASNRMYLDALWFEYLDTTPPSIACPSDRTVNADSGQAHATGVALGTPTASDDSGSVSVTNNAPAQFTIGTNVVRWTATDPNGNTNACTQLVVVRDAQAPGLACPPDVTVNADAGQCYATGAALGTATASDNSGSVAVTNNSPAQLPLGTNVVTWIAFDPSGNSNTCAQLVVARESAPLITTGPESRTNNAGTLAAFTVSATACSTPGYQWYFGAALLAGKTNSTFSIPSVLPVNAGPYSVVVSSLAGSVTSAVATLTVTLPPQGVLAGVFSSFPLAVPWPRNPYSRLIQTADGRLYGTTCNGGVNNLGTVFQLSANGTLTGMLSLDNVTGAKPLAGLLYASDGNAYGTASAGGSGGGGTLFRATLSGTLTPLLNFDGDTGSNSLASLIQASDGTLYGTTAAGGPNGCGTAFGFNTNSGLVLLSSFATTNGAQPAAGLLPSGRTAFFGTASAGGSNGLGTVFRFGTNGSLTEVCSFSGPDGAAPKAALTRGSDGNYYGTTSAGGSNNLGTVFQLTPGGAVTTLVSFNGTNGADPRGELLEAGDGNFYGTTWAGGAYGSGTVFRLKPNGALSTLLSLNSTTGVNPSAGLLEGSDGILYGTTVNSGPGGGGTVFQVTLDPRILMQPAGLTTLAGATVKLSVLAQGTAPLAYQWQFNGTDLADGGNISGALSPTLSLTSVATNQSGSYTVLVAGPAGLVTSSSAALTVLPPGTIVVGTLPDGNVALSFNTISNLPLRIEASTNLLDWLTLTNIPDAVGTVLFQDLEATNQAQRFYRAVWAP
jgi:uncharacterized repeat protein (TIGR03803 family)